MENEEDSESENEEDSESDSESGRTAASNQFREGTDRVKRNGWQKPFHKLQITTWVLFALQQAYLLFYVVIEISL